VIGEGQQRVEPERFQVRVASCLSECAVTRLASISITTRPCCTGGPAWSQTRSRAAARAVLIAARTESASEAKVAISRDTVESEATRPNTPGWARSTAISAAASPPNATATARSVTIFPGSWTASGLRHRPNSRDSCPARPLRRAVSTSNTPPACDTSDSPPMITDNQGRKSLCFTRGVPLSSIGLGLDNHNQTALSRHFRVSGLRVSPTRSTSVKARG
jgi:hypothetical protein